MCNYCKPVIISEMGLYAIRAEPLTHQFYRPKHWNVDVSWARSCLFNSMPHLEARSHACSV